MKPDRQLLLNELHADGQDARREATLLAAHGFSDAGGGGGPPVAAGLRAGLVGGRPLVENRRTSPTTEAVSSRALAVQAPPAPTDPQELTDDQLLALFRTPPSPWPRWPMERSA